MPRSMTEGHSVNLTSDPREIELLLETLDAVLEKSKLGELPAFRFRCAVIEVVNKLESLKLFLYRSDGKGIDWAFPFSLQDTGFRMTSSTGERFFAA